MRLTVWIMMIVSVTLLIVSQAALKYSLRALDQKALQQGPMHCAVVLARQPLFWVCIAMSGVIFLLVIYNLVKLPLNVFAPIYTTLYFIGLLLTSVLLLHESVSLGKIIGYGLLIAGLILIGRAG